MTFYLTIELLHFRREVAVSKLTKEMFNKELKARKSFYL